MSRWMVGDWAQITLPESQFKKASVSDEVPYTELILKRKGELSNRMGCLRQLLAGVATGWNYVDFMSGLGFCPSSIICFIDPETIWLNDLDPKCVALLKKNFGRGFKRKTSITNYDFREFPFGNLEFPTIGMVDFNTYSLKKFPEWESYFVQLFYSCEKVILTDSGPYPFRYNGGEHIQEFFGCRSVEAYYQKCFNTYLGRYGVFLTKVAHYPKNRPRVAVFLFERSPLKKSQVAPVLLNNWSPVPVTRLFF